MEQQQPEPLKAALERGLRARLLASAAPKYVRKGNSLRRVPDGSHATATTSSSREAGGGGNSQKRRVVGCGAPSSSGSSAAQPVRRVSVPAAGFESVGGGMGLQRRAAAPSGSGKAVAGGVAEPGHGRAAGPLGAAPARMSVDFKRRRELSEEAAAKRAAKSRTLCADFCRHGSCSRAGRECPYEHDPERVAICQPFLHGLCSGVDADGEPCPLSHTPAPERLPACRLYLTGLCTAAACDFPHVHHGSGGELCAAFSRAGYCVNGAACEQRHALNCVAFVQTGECALGDRCKLGRGRRAHASARPAG